MSCSSNYHYDKVFVVSSVGIKRIECIDRPFLPGRLNRTSTNSADLEETARNGPHHQDLYCLPLLFLI